MNEAPRLAGRFCFWHKPRDKPGKNLYTRVRCGCGGTGRRARLKTEFFQQSVGSIPSSRTIFLSVLIPV